jgi:hypothetical protein
MAEGRTEGCREGGDAVSFQRFHGRIVNSRVLGAVLLAALGPGPLAVWASSPAAEAADSSTGSKLDTGGSE